MLDPLQEAQGTDTVTATLAAIYPRAGRYIVRATATSFDGTVATANLAILVYKRGDTGRSAKCCRNTAYVIAGVHPDQWNSILVGCRHHVQVVMTHEQADAPGQCLTRRVSF